MSDDRHSPFVVLPPTHEEIFGENGKRPVEIELGMLQMQILWLLNRKSAHGYDLMKALNDLKTTKVMQGTLYPTLQRLEELGLIKRKEDGRKIIYNLTTKGKKVMNDACADFCRTFLGVFHDFVCGKCVENTKERIVKQV